MTEDDDEIVAEIDPTPIEISFAEFLETVPPGQSRKVKDLFGHEATGKLSQTAYRVRAPQLRLHCENADCNGVRTFRIFFGDRDVPDLVKSKSTFLTYQCSDCRRTIKTYSIRATADEVGEAAGECFKFGERPAFGTPTPSRLLRLLGKADADLFLKGRRSELAGLGIGAFGYYRRVVENQKGAILDAVISVAKLVGAKSSVISALESAKEEKQFAKAVELVKDAIPESLLINGHNPLTLLHRALSGGLHNESDEICLGAAQDIRIVLVALAERLGQALKDEEELNNAVNRLMNPPKRKNEAED
ncbi:hypothetical protein IZ6_28550 [Terrihabitans soli]|uniref:Uncharacterized protein n=1 Tax=Terrihabitans soli TaxID=708113 RepID=A0A6S6QYG7_9HYPH|nr:hypothetical protein [Terrihabitans soli]BCJ92120.1 hypothetical protein IZ6_28550 [Terrihabitans soli]